MPVPVDTKHTRFRRIMFLSATVSLVGFLWTIWMLVHFNNGPASIRFGASTMLKIASVALPGPALLAFVGWQHRLGPCRAIGWLSFIPALLLSGMLAVYSSVELRPPFSPGDYDEAAKEFEAYTLGLVNRESAVVQRLKDVRDSLRQRPYTREVCGALAARAAAVREDMEKINNEYHSYEAQMNAPFDKRGVGTLRRDEYIRLISRRLQTDVYLKTQDGLLRAARSFEERLKLLTSHWGEWHWQDTGAPLFDNDAFNMAYDDLVDQVKSPAVKEP